MHGDIKGNIDDKPFSNFCLNNMAPKYISTIVINLSFIVLSILSIATPSNMALPLTRPYLKKVV